jgi:predicted mannosyl-3-phosphoglycerate phosphatase (HAD superfamily)
MQWLPEGWRPKVVAVDIDGTLTDGKKQLDTGAVEALRRLEAAGIPVVLATGNVRAITYGLWRFLNLSGPNMLRKWRGPLAQIMGRTDRPSRWK